MTLSKYYYIAFGLTIESDIYFPELPPIELGFAKPDIQIYIDEHIEAQIENPRISYPWWQANENSLRLHIKNVGIFLITAGQKIAIKPYIKNDIASIRLFVLGSCMGALLMQRNYFLLHGNAIQIGDYCISIVGDSGAGKSTLCGAFFKQGYSILADDVCAISSDIKVSPSFPQMKLWQDAAHHLQIKTDNLRKIRPHTLKFAIPLKEQFQPKALPIRAIYQLNSNTTTLEKREIKGAEKLKVLHTNIYRKQYLKGLNKLGSYFNQSIQIVNKVSIIELSRPKDIFQLSATIDFIKNDLNEKSCASILL